MIPFQNCISQLYFDQFNLHAQSDIRHRVYALPYFTFESTFTYRARINVRLIFNLTLELRSLRNISHSLENSYFASGRKLPKKLLIFRAI